MSRFVRARRPAIAPGKNIDMTITLSRSSASAATKETAAPAPTLFWYNDDTELYDVTALVIQLGGGNRPESPYGPAFVARLFDVPQGATIAWTWAWTGSAPTMPKVIGDADAHSAAVMPLAGGTGAYSPGQTLTLSAQVIDADGLATDLDVTIEFIGA